MGRGYPPEYANHNFSIKCILNSMHLKFDENDSNDNDTTLSMQHQQFIDKVVGCSK